MSDLPEWPLFGLADDMRPAMAQAQAAGEPFALATLVSAQGGAPRPLGAQMLIGEGGRLSGFLSGGCVEGDVAAHARACLADGTPRRLVYGEGSPWPDIRLLCGARIEVLVEALPPADPAVAALLAARAARRPAWLETDGAVRQARLDGPDQDLTWAPPTAVRRFEPVPRLAVVGGDPTALAIAALGAGMGFETSLLRPKGPDGPSPLPGVAYDRRAPETALAALGLDPWTHVAVATHDLEVDEAALLAALPSLAASVGVLGARRRIPERLARLRAAGVSEEALARLKAPIGLDLGGKSPFEIAVAVMAEIVAHRRKA